MSPKRSRRVTLVEVGVTAAVLSGGWPPAGVTRGRRACRAGDAGSLVVWSRLRLAGLRLGELPLQGADTLLGDAEPALFGSLPRLFLPLEVPPFPVAGILQLPGVPRVPLPGESGSV